LQVVYLKKAFMAIWKLENLEDELRPLLLYVRRNYIGKFDKSIIMKLIIYLYDIFQTGYIDEDGKVKPPRFDPAMWNCFERVNAKIPRTTCALEAYHHYLNAEMTTHGRFGTFVPELQRQLQRGHVKLAAAAKSGKRKRSKSAPRRDKVFDELVADFGNLSVKDYLLRAGRDFQKIKRMRATVDHPPEDEDEYADEVNSDDEY
jgi:hypothetical protein